MADTTAYTKVQPLSAVVVTNNYNVVATPYGLNGIAIPNESDHEGIQSYRTMSEVEQDWDVDSNVWTQANAYFSGLTGNNGLFQVVSYDRHYGQSSGGNTNPSQSSQPQSRNIPGSKPGETASSDDASKGGNQ